MKDLILDGEVYEVKKFFAIKSIALATFFGSPLAAGFLIGQNYRNQGNSALGVVAVVAGILTTILLFIGILSLPDQVVSKIPNLLVPLIYTTMISFFVDRLQGPFLRIHRQQNGGFYSMWIAFGVGFICMLTLVGFLWGSVLVNPDNFDKDTYDQGMTAFKSNEEEALKLFTLLDNEDFDQASDFIKNTGIAKWLENLKILAEMDKLEGIYPDLKEQNELLRRYCQLRIQSYQLIHKKIIQHTSSLDVQIEDLDRMIGNILEKLNRNK
ncbi:MAG: hypothetical protein KDC53_05370 [Saprospiraceae bacterium]|nr:hypothetical protein [Saprospiraceae bacterium]